MLAIYKLSIASLKMFYRNRQALYFTVFFPLILMGVFGLIGFDKPPKIDVGLVAQNPSPETKQFVDQIKNFPTFEITEGTLESEQAALDKGDRAVVIEVPPYFMQFSPKGTSPKTVKAYINEGKQGEAQAVVSILNQFLDKTTLQAVKAPQFFAVESQVVNSRNLRYFDFLLPGLLSLSIMQMAIFSVAFVFTQYKEKGVLKRIFATPLKPSAFVISNAITRLIIAMFQAALFIIIGVLVFNANVTGSYFLVALVIALGALMFLGLGFTVSGLAKTIETVPAIANLIAFPMLFLGDTFFPISSMPTWLQHIAKYLPLTYFSSALRSVMTEAATIGEIKWKLLAMTIWCVVLIAVAMMTFRVSEKEG